MGRKLTRSRPKQGARLAELRKAAGLTHYDLARKVGVPQPNIAFWELSSKPPRSDVLPKLAKALGVTLDELIEDNSAKDILRLRRGPSGKLRKLFDDLSL